MVNPIGMEYNQVFLQNSSILENALADFAQKFTKEKQNPTNCYYKTSFHLHLLISEL